MIEEWVSVIGQIGAIHTGNQRDTSRRLIPLVFLTHKIWSKWDWLRSEFRDQNSSQRAGSVPVPFATCALDKTGQGLRNQECAALFGLFGSSPHYLRPNPKAANPQNDAVP